MNVIQKSEAIKNGLRKGFQDDGSKMAKRKCYGFGVDSDGELAVNPEEAQVVCWIFERYFAGDSPRKIAAGLESRTFSPTDFGDFAWRLQPSVIIIPESAKSVHPCGK